MHESEEPEAEEPEAEESEEEGISLEQHLADRETQMWKDYAENPVDIQVTDDSLIVQPLTQEMLQERMNERAAASLEWNAIQLATAEWVAKWKSPEKLSIDQEYDRELLKGE